MTVAIGESTNKLNEELFAYAEFQRELNAQQVEMENKLFKIKWEIAKLDDEILRYKFCTFVVCFFGLIIICFLILHKKHFH